MFSQEEHLHTRLAAVVLHHQPSSTFPTRDTIMIIDTVQMNTTLVVREGFPDPWLHKSGHLLMMGARRSAISQRRAGLISYRGDYLLDEERLLGVKMRTIHSKSIRPASPHCRKEK